MSLAGREIAVVGAGIGGLAAATALAQRRARVRLFEQAPALAEVGAGIQVAPNGVAVLEALGLRDAAEAHASLPEAIELRDWRGGAGRAPAARAGLRRALRPPVLAFPPGRPAGGAGRRRRRGGGRAPPRRADRRASRPTATGPAPAHRRRRRDDGARSWWRRTGCAPACARRISPPSRPLHRPCRLARRWCRPTGCPSATARRWRA